MIWNRIFAQVCFLYNFNQFRIFLLFRDNLDEDDKDILNANVVLRRKKGRKQRQERPKSLSTIDGRKRLMTSSKSIEQLLYPFR